MRIVVFAQPVCGRSAVVEEVGAGADMGLRSEVLLVGEVDTEFERALLEVPNSRNLVRLTAGEAHRMGADVAY